ncbi:Uu.00g005870.m01.CDS01 [Anthostomella pinea]|uniref:Uu.00g005870.m01.CDS01 n=1 Tax=Anthostomella pinea TaxID=933095 RepID=A0AAI8VKU6_9PEZI|nr:Uu.00g005870.m01.CDS01 [Anthostomella pinea]
MYTKSILAAALLSTIVASSPMPADVNVPITDAEMQALEAGGLKARGGSVNVPITDAEMAALEAGGLNSRIDIQARDKVMNCGHLVTGKGGSNGHGKWVPVDQFGQLADTFCKAYVGTDIYKGHETSDTYAASLTNQDDDTQPGDAGNIVFAIYNTDREGSYVVDHDTCLRAMKGPLGSHITKRDGKDYVLFEKRDNCYGTKHNDYEGGYYKVDGIGAFGSEVYSSS